MGRSRGLWAWLIITVSSAAVVRSDIIDDIQDIPGTEVCFLPKAVGPCAASERRYYFSTVTCKCESFQYSLCGGNANNFPTQNACHLQCGSLYLKSICEQKGHKCLRRPVEKGLAICYRSLQRFFYNAKKCCCEEFYYSGCRGTENVFMTRDDCKKGCSGFVCRGEEICNLPLMKGGPKVTCTAYFPRYGFNTKTCKCEQFIYGGCGGNNNRYSTMEHCDEVCGDIKCTPMCKQPADPGPCEALMPMYFYNSETCRCESFVYGGCKGNDNRFESLGKCNIACSGSSTCNQLTTDTMCNLPKDPGPCKGHFPRFYFDALECKCKKFIYGGCKGNENNFETRRECKRSCGATPCPVCNLPKKVFPCKRYVPSFYFNIQTCQCEKFIYGGCDGNGNRWETLAECQAVCRNIECPVCNLPPSKGPCKAWCVRWYYDPVDCVCKKFIYGECGGNLNRFHTQEDCQASCGSFPCPVCEQPKNVGPCYAAIPRWYYDTAKGKCKKFSWGGCQPNGNNFKKRKDCKKICKGFICKAPKKVGPCRTWKRMYYYDSEDKKCKAFVWGGCEPNGNNFKNLKSCQRKCVYRRVLLLQSKHI